VLSARGEKIGKQQLETFFLERFRALFHNIQDFFDLILQANSHS
jgi:hypothetical protein